MHAAWRIPRLNHPFSHPGHPQHLERLAAYWGEALGGPPVYSGAYGADHSHVVSMHSGNGDLSDLNRRFVACFVAAADDAGLPDDPAFRAALRAYMEWAVGEVSRFPEHDADVPASLPVPRWGWEGLQTTGV